MDQESHDDTSRPSDDSRSDSESTGYRRDSEVDEQNKKTMLYSVGLMMFTFVVVGLGSIPMYRWVCQKLNPGGSTAQNGTVDSYEGVDVDESRTIDVRFTANVQNDLPWSFGPQVSSVEVHPGEKKLVHFQSSNRADRAIKGKAVYDVIPAAASQYFKKVECFCFQEQTLEGGQTRDMPLKFWLEPDLPEDIDEVTLAYTFFNAESSRDRNPEPGADSEKHSRRSD